MPTVAAFVLVSLVAVTPSWAQATRKQSAEKPRDAATTDANQDSEEGFVPLFDGKSLEGWQGAVDGYDAKEGVLICTEKGGNLYTKKEYSDFHLKFEFKLTPGANNGLGVRTPLDGDAAYEGMELQILDDTHEQYADIKPWQYHGSVYGVVPAKRGHLRPVGEWNEEEVICRGPRVTVKLNGEVIVDADVRKASEPETVDGREHPGLARDKGFLAFCGHGAHLEFRNLRIMELGDEETE